MKKALLIIGGILLVLIVVGVAAGGQSSGPTKVDSQSQTDSVQATPTDQTFKVGDTAKLGDREFTVNSAKRSAGFGYNTPKSGKEYVIVNVTIRNLGKDEVSYNPFDFKMQDANGAQESSTFASLDDSLNSGTLAGGGKVTGSMAFEVPKGDAAKLIFTPSFWSSQRIVVEM
ncbi:MAG: DUF4352 domain-containing protein [Candidatus Curtissbacteria bacterium]|nr:DUF4352 domain-containing protein [Candidatus Curtissbacteria bacterium]